MVYKGSVWHLLFILKPILPLEKFRKILLNGGLWSNLLKKAAIKKTSYFVTEEEECMYEKK